MFHVECFLAVVRVTGDMFGAAEALFSSTCVLSALVDYDCEVFILPKAVMSHDMPR